MFINEKQMKDAKFFKVFGSDLVVCTAIALIDPLFIKEGEVFDSAERRVGTIFEVSTPQELQKLQPADEEAENVVIDLLDWQVC